MALQALAPLQHDVLACARVRRLPGKQVAVTCVEPATWFGDIAPFDGPPRTHDVYAHGATTLLVVHKSDFKAARPSMRLVRRCGVEEDGGNTRIGLALAQEDLAQRLGASRQRANAEPKALEREVVRRVAPSRQIVLPRDRLMALSE